jgi:uncharacterized membrane-anchored protein YhcB (DUF1043 family)
MFDTSKIHPSTPSWVIDAYSQYFISKSVIITNFLKNALYSDLNEEIWDRLDKFRKSDEGEISISLFLDIMLQLITRSFHFKVKVKEKRIETRLSGLTNNNRFYEKEIDILNKLNKEFTLLKRLIEAPKKRQKQITNKIKKIITILKSQKVVLEKYLSAYQYEKTLESLDKLAQDYNKKEITKLVKVIEAIQETLNIETQSLLPLKQGINFPFIDKEPRLRRFHKNENPDGDDEDIEKNKDITRTQVIVYLAQTHQKLFNTEKYDHMLLRNILIKIYKNFFPDTSELYVKNLLKNY